MRLLVITAMILRRRRTAARGSRAKRRRADAANVVVVTLGTRITFALDQDFVANEMKKDSLPWVATLYCSTGEIANMSIAAKRLNSEQVRQDWRNDLVRSQVTLWQHPAMQPWTLDRQN